MAVRLSSIAECDTLLVGIPYHADHLRFVGRRTIGRGHAHTAKPKAETMRPCPNVHLSMSAPCCSADPEMRRVGTVRLSLLHLRTARPSTMQNAVIGCKSFSRVRLVRDQVTGRWNNGYCPSLKKIQRFLRKDNYPGQTGFTKTVCKEIDL